MLLEKFICYLLRVVESNDVETSKQIVTVVRYIPISMRLAPAYDLKFPIFTDPKVAYVKVFVRNVAFVELIKYCANVIKKHCSLNCSPSFIR